MVRKHRYSMRFIRNLREPEHSNYGVSTITGMLLIVALALAIASVVYYLTISGDIPQDITVTGMRILAFNASTIGVTSMVGGPIPLNSVTIAVGDDTYDASGVVDHNGNGLWDPGETIYLYELDLQDQNSVVVTTDTQVLMPGTVQWSGTPVPANGDADVPRDSDFVSYRPGIVMTAYADTEFENPLTARVIEGISFACPEGVSEGYATDDPSWPESDTGRDHDFGVRFSGYVYVDGDDTYSFRITASDSVEMLVDGHPEIIVAGTHAPRAYDAEVYMAAGYHEVVIYYSNYVSPAVIGGFYISRQPGGEYMSPSLFYLGANPGPEQ